MNFSEEQKEILKVIHEETQRGDAQPKTMTFLGVIRDLLPKECFFQFGKGIKGFRFSIYDARYKDERSVDLFNGYIITYLTLISALEKEGLLLTYEGASGLNLDSSIISLSDKNGVPIQDMLDRDKLVSNPIISTTISELLFKYANKIIHPSYSLIKYVDNDFKTDEQILNEQNLSVALESLKDGKNALEKSTHSIRYAIAAIFISLIVGAWGIVLAYNENSISRAELDVDKQELEIDRESLDFSKLSSTEEKQEETNDLINSNNELISTMTATIDSLRIEVRNLQLKKRGK